MIVDQRLNKKILGVYLIDGDISGVQIAASKKPNIIRKFIIKLLFGWKFITINELKNLQKNVN